MSIHILDSSTINKIAAGEVIERPASIVKELSENAIDAGASAVTIEIRDGGIALIRVTDNGCGIPSDEVRTAFLRHATSKISTADDLTGVKSLGFRGEALSSIAAVCRTEVITKTRDALTGVRFVIEGGEEKAFEEIGAPEGTTMIARDIFFHVPVRRKFLKSAAAEGAHVAELAEEIALSHPEIAVRFLWNGRNRFGTSGNGNAKDVIYQLFGRDIALNLIAVSYESAGIAVRGFIGKPEISHGSRAMEHYFVNGRSVKSALLAKAIEDGYGNRMMQHSFPFAVLYLSSDPSLVDVNVHPTKREVRFSSPETVYDAVKNAVEQAIGGTELIRNVHLGEEEKSGRTASAGGRPEEEGGKKQKMPAQFPEDETGKKREMPAQFSADETEARSPGRKTAADKRRSVRPAEPFEEKRAGMEKAAEEKELSEIRESAACGEKDGQLTFFSPDNRGNVRLVGEVFDTYWIAEWNDALYIIDQHAAHEKVNYERLLDAFSRQSVTSQQLMPPVILTLTDREALLLRENQDAFRAIGYEIEPFGGRTYAVRAVPDILPSVLKENLLKDMIGELTQSAETSSGKVSSAGLPKLLIEKTASMSCKASVKGNEHISAQEAEKLLDELFSLKDPYNCPHGRPTVIRLTKRELEKRFRRVL